MKKLIRWQYKEFLLFLVVTMIGCIAFLEQDFISLFFNEYHELADIWNSFYMDMELDMFVNNIFYFYFETLFLVLTGSILVKKIIHYWNLKDEYGRCYFGSLPFKKTDYCLTTFLGEMLIIILTIAVTTIYMNIRIKENLEQEQICIPWMNQSFLGMAVITGCYLIFLLGIYYLLESLFVNGFVKLVGSLGILGIVGMILERLLNTFPQNKMVVDSYGFLTMVNTAGNCQLKEYTYRGEIYRAFMHPLKEVPYLYMGEEVRYTASYVGDMDSFMGEMAFEGAFCRFYDFSLIKTYLPQSVIYVLAGFLLAGCALWLTNRQEESKATFYHAATKYMLCVLFAVSVFFMSFEKDMSVGRICMAIVSAVAVLVLSILLTDKKRGYVHRKIKKN